MNPSKSCESSLYMQRLVRLQRKLPPQGICPRRPTGRLLGLYVLRDTSSRSFSLWRFNIGLVPKWAFIRASKLSRTGPRVNPESIPPTLAPKHGLNFIVLLDLECLGRAFPCFQPAAYNSSWRLKNATYNCASLALTRTWKII